jgi:hypothetical protein
MRIDRGFALAAGLMAAAAAMAVTAMLACQEEDATAPVPCSIGPVADTGLAAREALKQQYLFGNVGIGLSAPTSWMNDTRSGHGCQWRWLAQYFSGGVAHGDDPDHHGWDEVFQRPWNQWVNPDSIPGMWGRQRIEDAINSGYMPWITMYNLSQSAPANYQPGPPEAVATNIRVASTMRAYFEQFKLFFQIAAEYREHPIVVHVEPDEWGHMLLTVSGTMLDPEAVSVRVGSTGMPEICDLPDNVVGYARAIRRLRDMYPPTNALLCVSPSRGARTTVSRPRTGTTCLSSAGWTAGTLRCARPAALTSGGKTWRHPIRTTQVWQAGSIG